MSGLSFYHDVILVLHLIGLSMGLGAGIVNMFVVRWARESADNPDRPSILMALQPRIAQISTIGLGVLVITGLLLLFTVSGTSSYAFGKFWFYMKLLGAAAMIAIGFLAYQAQGQIKRGETPTYGQYLPLVGPAMGVLAVLVVLFSAFVFH
jgi:uncharacterized membrane protein SirB2